MVMKVICAADVKLKFKDTYDRLILANATDEYAAEESNLARARRGQTTEGIKGKHVPEIPKHVLKTARDASSTKAAVSVILKWKRIKNKKNRDLRPDELQQKPAPKKESNPSHKKGGKETRKQKRRHLSLSHDEPSKKRRVTKTRQVTAGLKEPTVQVSIKDPNEDDPQWTKTTHNGPTPPLTILITMQGRLEITLITKRPPANPQLLLERNAATNANRGASRHAGLAARAGTQRASIRTSEPSGTLERTWKLSD